MDNSLIVTLLYVGSKPERALLPDQFEKCNVVITSYDIVRKDIDFLGNLSWNYCILDEGHIIKNSKSKITSAVKHLKAEHRLILSGTPIQNNVLELWSLFDFLMPGFLGTERQFQTTYGKPLSAARDSKCSAKDAEAGVLAMEALHKQVMPFLLRRTKDEVLSDLPEKIIQDSVAYFRLDGSVESEKRYDIVKAFNSGPTIDVLLLTTHVGGLGLNLTSTDTLAFMEHDWNPVKDLQAMDRAHRLGQRKVVNVHRLIMCGSLEERVMSQQKFKVTVANAVINAENASLKTMNIDQLLYLFASSSTVRMGTQASTSIGSNMDNDPKSLISGKGLKSIISELGELWDQSQYEEYNLNQFLEKLNS